MKALQPPDSHYVAAALGWLELGNLPEAREELWKVSPGLRYHPDVLHVRYGIHAKMNQWDIAARLARAMCKLAPQQPAPWVHCAFALHQMARTQESWDVLREVADRFPEEYIISYDLACYACKLGYLQEARDWIRKSEQLAGVGRIKEMALRDSDLEPLWEELAGAV